MPEVPAAHQPALLQRIAQLESDMVKVTFLAPSMGYIRRRHPAACTVVAGPEHATAA